MFGVLISFQIPSRANLGFYLLILLILLSLLLVTSCGSTSNKSKDYLSVVINDRTKKEIIRDLETIVSNYGYFLFSESETEVVFETHPDRNSEIAYVKYDKNYRNNYYSGYRNRNLKMPHYQIIFDFTRVDRGYLVESKVEYVSWQHMHDQNRNESDGVQVQKILNELKYNTKVDLANTKFIKYRTIHQLLRYEIATHKTISYKRKNYVRKVVLSSIDFNRQVKALVFVRKLLKNYCNFSGGVFEEENDNRFYSSKGIKIPNVFFNGFNRANDLKAFGIKSCLTEEGVIWRLMIKPKVIKPPKVSDDKELNRQLTKFNNPEIYLYIHMLANELPSFMDKEG